MPSATEDDPLRVRSSRVDRTPLELFIAGVPGWETALGRKFENGKSRQFKQLQLSFPGKTGVWGG
jgi:hypothetical protein